MFDNLKVHALRKLISQYKAHHNIKGYSKMKKPQLVNALNQRFILHDNQLYFKPSVEIVSASTKKRIQPIYVQNPIYNPSYYNPVAPKAKTKGLERVQNTIQSLEDRYKNYNRDEVPSLSFRT